MIETNLLELPGVTVEPVAIRSYHYGEAMGTSVTYFPPSTIHIAVVDPGVGSGRRGIIVRTTNRLFVGPDNGIFSFVIARAEGKYRAVHIAAPPFTTHPLGPTFHGRDVFAPVAARLSLGADPETFGPEIDDLVVDSLPHPYQEGNRISGEVIHTDRFGNAITNITVDDVPYGLTPTYASIYGVSDYIPLKRYYAEASEGLACLFNSSGFLEFFVPRGRAKDQYGIHRGTSVQLVLSPKI